MIDFDEVLAVNSTRFREVLAGVPDAARVPSCPDWSAADLLWHLTEVQGFWATIVEEGLHTDEEVHAVLAPPRRADRGAALAQFDAVSARLRAGLAAARDDAAGVELVGGPHHRLGPASAGAGGTGPPGGC